MKRRKANKPHGMVPSDAVTEQLRRCQDDTRHGLGNVEGRRPPASNPDIDAALEAFRRTHRKFHNAMRKLAR